MKPGKLVLFVTAAFAVAACTTLAPPLPTDTTASNRQQSLSWNDFSAADAARDCQSIAAERSSNAAQMDEANKAIQANRQSNETATYLGAYLILPYAATEGNYAEKDKIAALQQRQDTLIKLAAFKRCAE